MRETGDLAETMLRVTVPVVDVPLSTRKTDELAETMLRVLRAAVPLEEKSDYELDSLADRLQELLRQYEYHHNDDPPAFLKTILIEEMRDAIERVRQYKDLNRARREVAAAHERYDQAVERNKKLRQKIRAFFG